MSSSDKLEHAVLCANGRIHYGPEYLEHDDAERVRAVADGWTGSSSCGGTPHYIASRHRIVTAWEPVGGDAA